jgi:hypothetical protein
MLCFVGGAHLVDGHAKLALELHNERAWILDSLVIQAWR